MVRTTNGVDDQRCQTETDGDDEVEMKTLRQNRRGKQKIKQTVQLQLIERFEFYYSILSFLSIRSSQ